MILVLLVLQLIAGALVAAVGYFKIFLLPEGGPNRRGALLWLIGTVLFCAATLSSYFLSSAEAREQQRRLEGQELKIQQQQIRLQQLVDRLFEVTGDLVMATPRAPTEPPPAATGQVLTITGPPDGATVNARDFVEGRFSGPPQEVWLVVHPEETSAYWIQQPVSLHAGGRWRGMIYLGRVGSLDRGKTFEIIAIAGPLEPLQAGGYGATWPKARWASNPITVVRR